MSKSDQLTKILAVMSVLALSNMEAQQQPARSSAQNQTTSKPNQSVPGSNTQEKYDILNRDQIDNTDVYAIPFDDSEVEDEEELNRLEKKEVFPLPHSRDARK
ncbi:MAG: hypothetical protein H0V82_11070 [Candidatus Protochlamydia sp.]|nr:hypothetical protein [Candidatus Protochlamydia sp.]